MLLSDIPEGVLGVRPVNRSKEWTREDSESGRMHRGEQRPSNKDTESMVVGCFFFFHDQIQDDFVVK